MKQLTRSEFNKQGTTYKSVTSPATDEQVTQITDIVESNGNLAYSVDGSNFKTITNEIQKVDDVSEIYPSANALPILGQSDNGVVYGALTNGELPLKLYKYNASDSSWEYIDQAKDNVLYLDGETGLIYEFKSVSPYFFVTSYTKTSQLANDSGFVTQSDINTAVSAEATARQNADTTLQNNINIEAQTRAGADAALREDLDAEQLARTTADTNLQTAITTEAGDRATADTALQNLITGLQNSKQDTLTAGTNITIDANNVISATVPQITVDSALSTTSENPVQNKVVTTALNGKQPTLTTAQQNAVNSGVTSTTVTQVATNTTDIANLSTSKQDALTTTQLDAVNSGITSSLVTQISTNASDITAEATARANADTTLQTNIDAKYTKPSGGIPKTDLASAVQTSLGKADTALQSISSSDVTTALGFTPYNSTNPSGYTKVESSTTNGNIKIDGTETTVYTLPSNVATSSDITTVQNNINAVSGRVTTIEGEIPTQASSSNQLADKNFVNSSINAFAAYYITKNAAGDPFATKAELSAATTFYSGGATRVPTTNDYCIVLADESKQSETGVDPTTRYSYQGNQWEYQYTVNDTPLTAAQLTALNSGITSADVTQITTNANNITSLQSGKQDALNTAQLNAVNSGITSALVTQIGTNQTNITSLNTNKQNAITSTNKLDADLVDDATSTNKFVTSAEKTTWNNKQNALNTNQLNAVNSGVTSATVSQVATNTSNITSLQTSKQDKLSASALSYYGTCTTAAATQAKVVDCTGFVLETGVSIRVKFTNAQTYNGAATLNVNSTGAKSVKSVGTTNSARYCWLAGEVVDFVYDGTNYVMVDGGLASTTYYGATKLTSSATSTNTSTALTPASLNNVMQDIVTGYPVYSTSSTYAVGDRVRYSWYVYECNTAITTAEAWTAAHWTQVEDLQSQIDGKQAKLTAGTNITIDANNVISASTSGTSTDVQVNGTSITSNGVANIVTNTAYNSSSNKIATMSDVPTTTSSVTSGSTAALTSGGAYTALSGKQNTLTFDTAPTSSSTNPVTSGGVFTALSGKQNTLTFDSTPTQNSTNPVTSGGVHTALAGKQDKLTAGENITIDANNVISASGGGATQTKYPLVKTNFSSTWLAKTWSGLASFDGQNIWTDGTNIYYSNETTQYVLDVATSTWSRKTWSGLTSFYGSRIWTDGTNIYYSNGNIQFVLNVATSTWSTKTWSGLTNFNGSRIWTDGTNIYYSSGTSQYVLNVASSKWSSKTWSGLSSYGEHIWTDGTNIYYSRGANQYILSPQSSTWSTKTWGVLNFSYGEDIWTDGTNIYYSLTGNQYILDVATSTWLAKTWGGLTSFDGKNIWTDGTNIYYSSTTTQYVLGTIISTKTKLK